MFEPNIYISKARLTSDPQVRNVNGQLCVNVSIAVNPGYYDKNHTWQDGTPQFYDLSSFNNADIESWQTLHKGDQIAVSGLLDIRQYTDRNGQPRQTLKIKFAHIALLIVRPKTQQQPPQQSQAPAVDPFADDEWATGDGF